MSTNCFINGNVSIPIDVDEHDAENDDENGGKNVDDVGDHVESMIWAILKMIVDYKVAYIAGYD